MSLADLEPELECPVCFERFEAERIFMCFRGHSVCRGCVNKCRTRRCPLCREGFGGARNFALDGVIRKLNKLEKEREAKTQQPPTALPTRVVAKINRSASDAPKEDEFKCRMAGCTTRLPIKGLIQHVRDRHAYYLREFEPIHKPWAFKKQIVLKMTGHQCMYIIIEEELFALICQPDVDRVPDIDGYRGVYCWMQAACSSHAANSFSYRIRMISPSVLFGTIYYDYMRGECFDLAENREKRTCGYIFLPKFEKLFTLDVEMYQTIPGSLPEHRNCMYCDYLPNGRFRPIEDVQRARMDLGSSEPE